MRLPRVLAGAALASLLPAAAHATTAKQIAGAYTLLSSSDGAGCPKQFTYPEPVTLPSTPVSALLHRDISTEAGACAGGADDYAALLSALEYESRSSVPPDRNDPLVDALLRTDALFGTELNGDRVCGKFTLRKDALVAFVNSRDDADFLQDFAELKDGKTVALLAEANVDDPKRCVYVSNKAMAEAAAGGGACFPADATVQLESGARRRMDGLAVGDRVHVGRGSYSPVFMFTHRAAAHAGAYVELATASGARLRATAGHFVHAGGALVRADAVRAGDVMELGDGGGDVVAGVRWVPGRGLYNPQTVHGDVVVDGLRTSTYTSAVQPEVAHALLAPLRAVYGALGWSSAALEEGAPGLDRVFAAREQVY